MARGGIVDMGRIALLAGVCIACGTEAPPTGRCPATADGDRPQCDRYLPLAVGAWWKYGGFHPSAGMKSRSKRLSIESKERIPGCAEAFETEPKEGFKMLRDEDYGHSFRWQSEVP